MRILGNGVLISIGPRIDPPFYASLAVILTIAAMQSRRAKFVTLATAVALNCLAKEVSIRAGRRRSFLTWFGAAVPSFD